LSVGVRRASGGRLDDRESALDALKPAVVRGRSAGWRTGWVVVVSAERRDDGPGSSAATSSSIRSPAKRSDRTISSISLSRPASASPRVCRILILLLLGQRPEGDLDDVDAGRGGLLARRLGPAAEPAALGPQYRHDHPVCKSGSALSLATRQDHALESDA